MTEKIWVSGHRGDRMHGDENTMRAIRRAVCAGVDMVEIDVRMTKDGGLILMHDATVDRTTNGHGRVQDLTVAEVRALDAAVHRTDLEAGSESPALLTEVLEYLKSSPDVHLILEYKDHRREGDPAFVEEAADRITDLVLSSGLEERIIVNSFDGRTLEKVYERAGDCLAYHGFYPWYFMGPMDLDPERFLDMACILHWALEDDGTIVRLPDPLSPEEWYDYVTAVGIAPLAAPSLRTLENYEEAIRRGTRIVNADDPYELLEYLKKTGRHH